MVLKTVSLKKLDWDQGNYPREDPDVETISVYAQALRSGSKFPPILVVKDDDGYTIVDGVLRFFAHREVERKTIDIEIFELGKNESIYMRAVLLNSKNGKPFTQDERETIAGRLNKTHSLKEISKLLCVPVDDLQFITIVEKALAKSGKVGKRINPLKHRNIIPRLIRKCADFQTYLNMFDVGYDGCDNEKTKEKSILVLREVRDKIILVLNKKR